jgi:hypothetical protein
MDWKDEVADGDHHFDSNSGCRPHTSGGDTTRSRPKELLTLSHKRAYLTTNQSF